MVMLRNMQLLKVFRERIKQDLTTTTDIFATLPRVSDANQFVPVKTVFTDGFSITNPILKLSDFVKFLREECCINVYSSKRSWTNKDSKD